MPDQLSKEERALIDEAIEEGRVTRVPTGAQTCLFQPITPRMAMEAAWKKAIAARKKNPPKCVRSEQSIALDTVILQMAKDGMTYPQIGAKLGMKAGAVNARVLRMGILKEDLKPTEEKR